MKQQIQQGFDIVLRIGEKILGGQQNISFGRSSSPIDITNKINGKWKESLSGLNSWNIVCSGLYLVDEESYELLEDAFMNNMDVMVELRTNNLTYSGKALVIDFPLSSSFNAQFKYQLKLIGNGELIKK